LVDGIPTPLKNIGHLGLLFPIWKNKKNPNHQSELGVGRLRQDMCDVAMANLRYGGWL